MLWLATFHKSRECARIKKEGRRARKDERNGIEKQLDGPIPKVPETIRKLSWGSQNMASIAGNGERDHRERKRDRKLLASTHKSSLSVKGC